jgi:hypothetical protein
LQIFLFFLQPPVSTLLQTIDEAKIMYTARSNDLLIQSILARLFLSPQEIKWFNDFCYEHITLHTRPKLKGCPSYGALCLDTDLAFHTGKMYHRHFWIDFHLIAKFTIRFKDALEHSTFANASCLMVHAVFI